MTILFVAIAGVFGGPVAGLIYGLSTYALNLVIGPGLGLAVGYTLFIVSRFRGELDGGRTVAEAVATGSKRGAWRSAWHAAGSRRLIRLAADGSGGPGRGWGCDRWRVKQRRR